MANILEQDVMYAPGVGPSRKKILENELGIKSFGDLLQYYPYKYVDRSRIYKANELNADMPFVQLRGKILSFDLYENGPRNKRLVAHFADSTGVIDLIWFARTQYITKTYHTGVPYIVFG